MSYKLQMMFVYIFQSGHKNVSCTFLWRSMYTVYRAKQPYFVSPMFLNPLIAILKSQSNGPSYRNTVIRTLAVDEWAVTFGGGEGPVRAAAPPSPLLAVPNVTAHPSTASIPTWCYLMWHYNCLWSLKG